MMPNKDGSMWNSLNGMACEHWITFVHSDLHLLTWFHTSWTNRKLKNWNVKDMPQNLQIIETFINVKWHVACFLHVLWFRSRMVPYVSYAILKSYAIVLKSKAALCMLTFNNIPCAARPLRQKCISHRGLGCQVAYMIVTSVCSSKEWTHLRGRRVTLWSSPSWSPPGCWSWVNCIDPLVHNQPASDFPSTAGSPSS